ncbi:MAG: hypothetical protein L0Y57_06760, partial [Beijerinckiaceae bacterium]|nr:hypothetical protein [Beijerinckiaceae bacterium]
MLGLAMPARTMVQAGKESSRVLDAKEAAVFGQRSSAWGGHGGSASELAGQPDGNPEPEPGAQGILAVRHLQKSYKGRRVVEDVSM